jgi:hypothetical protein
MLCLPGVPPPVIPRPLSVLIGDPMPDDPAILLKRLKRAFNRQAEKFGGNAYRTQTLSMIMDQSTKAIEVCFAEIGQPLQPKSKKETSE